MRTTPLPGWHFRHFSGETLALLLDEQVLTGLALSGADEAAAPLRRAEQDASGSDADDRRLRRHAANARDTHRRWQEEIAARRAEGRR